MTWLNYLWIAGGIVLALVTIGTIVELIRERCTPSPPPGERNAARRAGERGLVKPNPDRWSGRCYTCGTIVPRARAIRLHSPGKPPKYFCPDCRPAL